MSRKPRTRSSFLRRTPIVAGFVVLVVSCVTTEKDGGTEYMISESKEESYLDAQVVKLTEEVRIYPKRHDLYYKIASIHFEREDFLASAAALQKAVELAPNESKYYFQLGRVHLRMQELELAEKAFRRAVELSPQDRYSGPRAALALVLSMRGESKESVEQFLRCLEVEPDNIEYYYSIGAQYDIMGKEEEAIHYFREYLLRGGHTYRKNTVFILQKLGVDVQDLTPPSEDDEAIELGFGVGSLDEFEPRPSGGRVPAADR